MGVWLAALLLGQGQKPLSDSEAILTAIADTFFTDVRTESKRGDVVVFQPKWDQGALNPFGREIDGMKASKWNFDAALSEWIEESASSLKQKGDASASYKKWRAEELIKLAVLKRVQSQVTKATAVPEVPLPDIKNMRLGERVVIGGWDDLVERQRYGWISGESKIKRPDGSKASARIFARLTIPLFSRDRKFAFISASIPWSIHSASLIYLFEKTPEGWKLKARTDQYYV